MLPTTKAKQRGFLDTLIANANSMTRTSIVRQLRVLRKQLHNRTAKRGRTTAPPTRSQRRNVLVLASVRPDMSMQEIAQKLRISIGRVSEILRGKRR